jgi:hypothetical protein
MRAKLGPMLLQGDDLAVQLFIGAAALTVLSVAVTQAGWTHKWFVRGMFGLAVLLAVASIGWPYFETKIPLVSEALQAITSSRIGWFFAGIIPAFVSGMLVSDNLRRRRETTTTLSPQQKNDLDFILHTLSQNLGWIEHQLKLFGDFQKTRTEKVLSQHRFDLEQIRNGINDTHGAILVYLNENKEYFSYLRKVLNGDEMLGSFHPIATEYLAKLGTTWPIDQERAAMVDVVNQRPIKSAAGIREWLAGATNRLGEMRETLH